MCDDAPLIALLCGSPRHGATEHLLSLVERGIWEAGGRTERFLLSEHTILPCVACDACMKTGQCVRTGSPGDNLAEFDALIKRADALAVFSPVQFAGPPSQLKALYDRCQWRWARRYVLGETPAPKRPLELFVVGSGGDPFGYEPLVTISNSALNILGFSLDAVHDFIGFDQAGFEYRFDEFEAAALTAGRTFAMRVRDVKSTGKDGS